MKLDREFLRLSLDFDVERMRAEVEAIPEADWRPHPQGHPGNSALPLIARGGDPFDDGVAGAMLPTPHLERCEYLAQVLEAFGTVFGRSRLMRLEGRSQATLHVDTNYYWAERVRVHVPILTSPEIEFVCEDERMHMRAGEAWIFDAWRPHDVLNPTGNQRIHLVADTVGSAAFWDLAGQADPPRFVAPRPGEGAALETEHANYPVVMSPWEQRRMLELILGDVAPDGDAEALAAFAGALRRTLCDWRIAWARFADGREGWPAYRALLDDAERRIAPLEGRIALVNGTDAVDIARQLLLRPGLNPELAPAAVPGPAPAPSAAPARRVFERPIAIVAPPRSGSTLLFETLARAPGLYTVGGESHALIEGIAELSPAERGWDSNRLGAVDARPEIAIALKQRIAPELRDRDGQPPAPGATGVRFLEKTPKNALRVGFLDGVFDDALFVYLHREPHEVLASLIESWSSGGFVTYPDLPGWPGVPWSHVLTPEWRALAGRPLPEVVAAQWAAATTAALDDLERLAPGRWIGVDYAALVADPERVMRRIAAFAGLGWDRSLPSPLPPSRHTLTPPDPQKWRAHEAEVAPLLAALEPIAARSRAAVAHDPAAPPRAARRAHGLRSVGTTNVPELLGAVGGSLLVSTYQTGKLVTVRGSADGLDTHFHDLDSPMGIAVDGDRLAVGTLAGVAEYRDVPAVAAKLAGADACFIPRRTHATGDIRIHDLAYAGGELWFAATRFSCLATLDEDHSFVPRWRPPFVSALTADDRCHLNGLAVVDDRVKWVTALGATGAPEGWRADRAAGGVLMDVDTGEVALAGLSMPHSPRWHDGRLWFLESGQGGLNVADPERGTSETVARLPGFTRGLSFAGPYAFVGLSQVREAGTFGGLPLTGRLEARQCGVWVVDLRSGEVVAFVRFEEAVQEIFEVAFLGGRRWPEIAEPSSEAALLSYVVPEDALAS